MSVMSTTFSALAMNITYLRESGVLKRIHGTPLPTSAYLAGIAGNAVTNTARAGRASITVGRRGRLRPRLAAGLGRARRVRRRSASCCFASLGVALSHVIPNFDSAPAYVNAVFLPVIFISGVFYDADNAPEFLRDIAEALPLKHLIDGLSGAMVTGEGLAAPRAGAGRARALDRGRDRARRARLLLGAPARLSAQAPASSTQVPPPAQRSRRRLDREPDARALVVAEQDRAVRRALEPRRAASRAACARPPQPQAIASAARAPLQPAARSRPASVQPARSWAK